MTHLPRGRAGFQVARLGPEDWKQQKTLRLEALRLEPDAFSSTYEDACTQPDEWWRARLARPDCTTLMARAGEQPIGMITACQDADGDHPDVGLIFGMYVNAQYRRQGVGRALLHAGIAHLASFPEIATIRLWVKATHQPARRLYESLGFRAIDDPCGQTPEGELQLERAVHLQIGAHPPRCHPDVTKDLGIP